MTAELGRLETVLTARLEGVQQQLSKLTQMHGQAAKKIQESYKKIDALEGLQGQLEGLASRMPMVGGALAALGPAGTVAAVAIAGLAAAVTQTINAMNIGDEIADQAQKIGVSTNTLQEYRYAIQQTGGEFRDADEALQGFTTTLGLARQGAQRQLKFFEKLGFTPDQLQSFTSADQALKAVTERIAGLDSEADRQAFASKLGLEKLNPLIREGTGRITELRNAAHELGIVMDADVVQKLGDANDKFEALSLVIKNQFAAAFVDAGPAIIGAMQGVVDILHSITGFIKEINSAPGFAYAYETGAGKGRRDPAAIQADYEAEQREKAKRAHPVISVEEDKVRKARDDGWRLVGVNSEGRGYWVNREGFRIIDDSQVQSVDPSKVVDPSKTIGLTKSALSEPDLLPNPAEIFDAHQQEIAESLRQSVGNGIEAAIYGGWPGLARFMSDNLKQKLAEDLTDVVHSFLKQILTANSASSSSGSANIFAQVLSTVFGGGRADGGAVRAGTTYLVGERGPELFRSGASGTIIPNINLGGGASSQPILFDLRGAVLTEDLLNQMNAIGQQSALAAVSASRALVPRDTAAMQRRRLA